MELIIGIPLLYFFIYLINRKNSKLKYEIIYYTLVYLLIILLFIVTEKLVKTPYYKIVEIFGLLILPIIFIYSKYKYYLDKGFKIYSKYRFFMLEFILIYTMPLLIILIGILIKNS